MKKHIQIDSLFLRFRDKDILKGISFSMTKHEISGILGRNASGKSCLLRVLIGHLNPQSKHFRVDNKFQKNLYKQNGLINYLPQHPFHPKSLKIKSLLKLYDIELPEFLYHYPFTEEMLTLKFGQLSGGQKRLLEVLFILESATHFSILDEPFTYLMPKYVDLIKNRILKLKERKGFIITDHQYSHILELSDKLYLLKEGRIQEIAGKNELRNLGYIP
ncbi:MAG: ATP-binding cassette domain-containing protein [Bacteroidota bacterium]